MAKVQLGDKHLCSQCGTKFYDFGREEVLCPQCGADPVSPAPESPREELPGDSPPDGVADPDPGNALDDLADLGGDDLEGDDLDGDELRGDLEDDLDDDLDEDLDDDELEELGLERDLDEDDYLDDEEYG